MKQNVPTFTSRRSALKYLAWYYKQDWWKDVRVKVYLHYHGICCRCGMRLPLDHGWSAHHETEAYNHLFEEDNYLHLMKLLDNTCHARVEEEKTVLRKALKREKRAQQKMRGETLKSKRKTTHFRKAAKVTE